MDFENSAIYPAMQEIIQTPTNVQSTWSATVHANGQDYPAVKVLNLDVNSDYLENFADETLLKLSLFPSMFLRGIYPYQEAVEITLYKYPIGEQTAEIDQSREFQSERFRAIYIDTGNPIVENSTTTNNDSENLDLSGFIEVDFQLFNKTVEQVRLIDVGRIYRQTTVEDAIKTILTTETANVNVDDAIKSLGVDMVPADNKVIREHIVIPHGMRLVDAPLYIHEKCGGVYSSGFNYYYHQDRWYVYPCFNTERNDANGLKLTILNIPKNKMPIADRTFNLGGSNLTIIATGDISFRDDSNVRRGNQGNGVRFANADNFMNGITQVAGNRSYVSRGVNNTEIVSTPNDAGMNNVRTSDQRITSNQYMEYSKLAMREGSVFGMVWENSDRSLIYPGMPAKVLYIDGEDIKELQGCLLKANHTTRLRGVGYTEGRYKTDTTLSIFVRRTLE